MARGYRITQEIKARVNSIRKKYPDWKPSKIRERLRGDLYLEVDKRPDLLPKLKRGWPSESSVRDIMKKAVNIENTDEFKEKEKPWCMGTLHEHPLSPDTVPAVLKVWKFKRAWGERLTIREAKWVALLSKLAKDTEQLAMQASEYACLERLYELAGRPDFDSVILDMFYMKMPIPIIYRIDDDERQWDTTFVPWIVSEGLKGEIFESIKDWEAYKEGGFLSIVASKEDIEFSLAEAQKIDKEWEAYKKEVRGEGKHKKKRQE